MAEGDLFDQFQAGREALRRLQESFARYAMPPEQRQALIDGMSQLMFPADGVRAMSDLIDAFGPPLAQIEALRSELAEQREQLAQLDGRLAHLEATAERLAIAGEQIMAFQEPYLRMAALLTGQDLGRRAARTASSSRKDEKGEKKGGENKGDGNEGEEAKARTAKVRTAKAETAKKAPES